jgi:hypothetical protein
MDYRTYLKTMMMRGKVYKSKGQGFVSINDADIPKMQLQNYSGGTISHRAIVDRVVDSMNNLDVSGKGARKKDYGIDALPTSAKKTKGSGNNFKSLKFNF